MPAFQAAIQVVTKALPFLAKQLPKLWPLLLETKNREKVLELVKELAASSPRRKLAAKMELTELLAETVAEKAANEAEKARALSWQRRAQRMRVRLDMPIAGARAKREHRRTLRTDLEVLHGEMTSALRDEEAPEGAR